jgi:hypothetical protein
MCTMTCHDAPRSFIFCQPGANWAPSLPTEKQGNFRYSMRAKVMSR